MPAEGPHQGRFCTELDRQVDAAIRGDAQVIVVHHATAGGLIRLTGVVTAPTDALLSRVVPIGGIARPVHDVLRPLHQAFLTKGGEHQLLPLTPSLARCVAAVQRGARFRSEDVMLRIWELNVHVGQARRLRTAARSCKEKHQRVPVGVEGKVQWIRPGVASDVGSPIDDRAAVGPVAGQRQVRGGMAEAVHLPRLIRAVPRQRVAAAVLGGHHVAGLVERHRLVAEFAHADHGRLSDAKQDHHVDGHPVGGDAQGDVLPFGHRHRWGAGDGSGRRVEHQPVGQGGQRGHAGHLVPAEGQGLSGRKQAGFPQEVLLGEVEHGPEACVAHAVVVRVHRRPRRIGSRVHAHRWRIEQRFAGRRTFRHEHRRAAGGVGGVPDACVRIEVRKGQGGMQGRGHDARGVEFGHGHREVAEHVGHAKAARRRPIQAEAVAGVVARPEARHRTNMVHVRRGAVDDEMFVIGQTARIERWKDPVHLTLTVAHHLAGGMAETVHVRGQAAWQRQRHSISVVGVERVVPRQEAEACIDLVRVVIARAFLSRGVLVAQDQERPVLKAQGLNRVVTWDLGVAAVAVQRLEGFAGVLDDQDLTVGVKEWSEDVTAVLIADVTRHEGPVFVIKKVGRDAIKGRFPVGGEGDGGTQVGGAVAAQACLGPQFEGLGHWIVFGQVEQVRAGIEAAHRQGRHRRHAVSAAKEHRGVPDRHRCWRKGTKHRALRRTHALVGVVPTVTVHVGVGRIARAVAVEVAWKVQVRRRVRAARSFIEVAPAVVVVVVVLGQRRGARGNEGVGSPVPVGVGCGACIAREGILMIEHAVTVVIVVPEVLDPVTVRVRVAQVEMNGATVGQRLCVRNEIRIIRALVDTTLSRDAPAEHFRVQAQHARPVKRQHAATEILGRVLDEVAGTCCKADRGRIWTDAAHLQLVIQGEAARLERHLVSVLHHSVR